MDDREIVLDTVAQKVFLLMHAAPEHKAGRDIDREIVLGTVEQKGILLTAATPDHIDDRVVVLDTVEQKGKLLTPATPDHIDDRVVVLDTVEQKGAFFTAAFLSLSLVLACFLRKKSVNEISLKQVKHKNAHPPLTS